MARKAAVPAGSTTPLVTLLVLGMGAAALIPEVASALTSTGSLKQLSVEELMNVEVYSASRHLEPTQAAPSAIFVLTNDDIRRSHVTSVPEALRLVPGVQVGRVDANKWAVSMRGFNSREANKLLVLVDGRSIYDPLFSGTLWESQDIMLEDIDRVEVIRGPGGTLWGANAFNGVINIVTRAAQDTQGALLSASAGDEERYTVAGRYGWQASEDQYARVYAKVYDRDTGFSSLAPPYDASRMVRGGFRWDWSDGSSDRLRVSGDLFEARSGVRETTTLVQDVDHRGRNLLARWDHSIATGNSVQLQAYYDHVDYESFGFDQHRDTYDLELQQNFEAGSRHLFVWGAGLRQMHDDTSSGLSGFVDVLPLRRNDSLTNVFIQDTFALSPDKLNLTLGVKYEDTDYAASEWLPNIRLAYTPNAQQTWWASIGEATRVPSRLESDLTFFGVLRLGDNFRAEHVRAYEVGHRQLVSPKFWYDVAVFYNDYDDLRSGEAGGQLGNFMHGNSRGAELAVRWEPAGNWRVDGAYTYLIMNLGLDPASTSNRGQLGYIQDLAARHQVTLRAAVDIADNLQFDATARYVDALLSLQFPAYTELDLALTWTARPGLDVSLVGQNLLHSHHPEQDFAFSDSMGAEVQRGFYGRIAWHF
ncbi:MAG TPA: TonB-dependent receptor [Steroidobacteraceae bacterium]|nr:TonB-dependent receptor [Steroidobacteraceae bacterium]